MNGNDFLLLINAAIAFFDVYLYKVYVMDIKKCPENDDDLDPMLEDIYSRQREK